MSTKNPFQVGNLVEALATESHPTVTKWNRLEGRPRTDNFERALKAEVRDALWFLTRQWQFGELRGSDAASPIFAKLATASTALTQYRPLSQPAEPYDASLPLQAQVEAQRVPFVAAAQPLQLDLRMLMGRKWLKLSKSLYAGAFKETYGFKIPDSARASDAAVCAHPESFQAFSAAAERCVDGGELYLRLKNGAIAHVYDDIPEISPLDYDKLDAAATLFVAWCDDLVHQPDAATREAWDPSRLEYRFSCGAPPRESGGPEHVLTAAEYYQGRLDWHSFDRNSFARNLAGAASEPPSPGSQQVLAAIPTPVSFAGMPNTRYWAFDDGRTNFGDVRPATTDIAKLLLLEFGLIYANDWFVLPVTLDAGTLTRVRGLMVTDVFGDRTWVEPAGDPADDWQGFGLFTNTELGTRSATSDPHLLLLPTARTIQESTPREEVLWVRDEMANLVWGVERTVWLPSGDPRRGAEAASETLAYHQRLVNPAASDDSALEPKAPIRYQVQNSVPEHWIPFIPVHVQGSEREVDLQRAGLPRIIPGDPLPPVKVSPRTPLLREGLDAMPRRPYFVHEEEVPRAGVLVIRSFRRARWRNGKAVVWYGARKQTGRGEGSSGLAFDQLVPTKSSDR
jgi:hypothetical protein